MASSGICNNLYLTNGSSALDLKETAPHLILLDGGNNVQIKNHPVIDVHSKPRNTVKAFHCICAMFASVALVAIFFIGDVVILSKENAALAEVSTTTVNVRKGDSLWTIASEHGVAGCSTNSVISWIKSNNQLNASNIYAGQVLIVPNAS